MACASEATPSALRRTIDSISDAAALRLFRRPAAVNAPTAMHQSNLFKIA